MSSCGNVRQVNRSCALLSNGTVAISTLANTMEPAVELVAAACLVFRGTGRIGEGLEYLDKALAVARTGSILEGNLIEERGHLLRAGARLPSALRAYEEALGIWVRQPRPDREAVCHLRIGDVLRLMGTTTRQPSTTSSASGSTRSSARTRSPEVTPSSAWRTSPASPGTGIGPSPCTPMRSRRSDRFRMGWWA